MGRQYCQFNLDWEFRKANDTVWEQVTLPHTWNAIDWVDKKEFYFGEGFYRKCFSLESFFCENKRVFVEFGAANTVAEVYVNDKFAGKHEGGYSAFRFDITDLVRTKGENNISVKVNNSPTDYIIPIADQGDFTKMGGLYREAQLIITEEVHIDLLDYGSSGIYITPQNISEKHAEANILVKLANAGKTERAVTVTADIYDSQKNFVTSCSKKVVLKSKSRTELLLAVFFVNPKLWGGRQNPHLYCAGVTVQEGEQQLDFCKQTFGIRTYRIDPQRGFFLNETYLDLRGVNYHQDSFETGWAMTDKERERDYRMMTDMGCTAVRMAHYQHAQKEYELCDKLGLCVWTEIGLVNKMSSDPTGKLAVDKRLKENAKQQLRELIRQNYNHPSVILWGISNELYQMSDEIYSIYCDLHALAREEDSTRLKTFADSQFWGRFLELPGDAVGYNRYFGWYKEAGPVEKFGDWLDEYHFGKESRPICVSEYGGGGALSQHKDRIHWETEIDPWGERHYENYQSELHEKIWKQFAARRYLWGKFVWCMFDFASTGRKEGDTVGINDKGLATRERVPKDAYYFYKSVWNEEPMIYLTEKRFAKRPGTVPRVKVYCNTGNAELFVNGCSLGVQYHEKAEAPGAMVYVWKKVALKPNAKNIVEVKTITESGIILMDKAIWIGEET